jgi:hypothetical protein
MHPIAKAHAPPARAKSHALTSEHAHLNLKQTSQTNTKPNIVHKSGRIRIQRINMKNNNSHQTRTSN